MFRVILLLAVLGVAHCVAWGFHNHNNGPDDFDNDSGPSSDHGHGFGWGHNHNHGCGWGHHGCGRHGGHDHNQTWHSDSDRRFERLAAYLIRAERFSKDLCEQYTPSNVQESHGKTTYKLTYSMPDVDPKNITVRIKHRALYMYARQSDTEGSPTYTDVRILPDTLKISDAVWTYTENQLNIIIPYDRTVKVKTEKTCVDVNVDIKDVPRGSPFTYRFGSEDETIQ